MKDPIKNFRALTNLSLTCLKSSLGNETHSPVALLMRAYGNDISQLWTGFLLNLFKSATCVLWEDKSASQIIAQSYQWSHWKVVPRRKFQWRCFFSQRNSAFQRINRILKGFFASHLQLMVSLRRNNGFPISWTFQITSLVLTLR